MASNTPFETDPFQTPAKGFARFVAHEGQLVAVTPKSYRADAPTVHGPAPEVIAHVVVLTDKDSKPLDEPVVYEEMKIFGKVLTGQLNPAHLERPIVLGVIGKQPSQQAGKNDAWVLLDPTDDDMGVFRAYWAKVQADSPFSKPKNK